MKSVRWTFPMVVALVAQGNAQIPRVELGFSTGVACRVGKNDMDVPFAIRCGVPYRPRVVLRREIVLQ
jgi:hypothetical protein